MRRCLYFIGVSLLSIMPFMSISSSAEGLSDQTAFSVVLASGEEDTDNGDSGDNMSGDEGSGDEVPDDGGSEGSDEGDNGDDSSGGGDTEDFGSELY